MQEEQAKLDRILSDPDPLLVQSLRRDEKRRKRIALAILGGLIMFAIVTTVAVSLLVSATAVTPDPAKSNAVTAEAWQLWQKHQMSEALDKFQEATKLNPDNADAWNGLGWVYFNSGSPDQAQVAWQKCLKLSPDQPAALNGLGQLALSQRQYDKAEQYLLKAANLNASAAWFGLARLYLLEGNYPQAQEWAQKLVTAEPGSQDAAKMLAAAKAGSLSPQLRQLLEPPPAKESARVETPVGKPGSSATSGRVDVPRSNALNAQAWQLWQSHQLPEALEKFREAVKLNPNNANAWNGLGWVNFNSGSYAEAQEAWEKCLKIMPNHPAALNGLGQLALIQRQYGKAEKYLLRAANMQASAAWFGLARLYLLQGKYEQAEKWAQKLVTTDPSNQEGTKMLAAAKARSLDPELRSQLEPPPAEAAESRPSSEATAE